MNSKKLKWKKKEIFYFNKFNYFCLIFRLDKLHIQQFLRVPYFSFLSFILPEQHEATVETWSFSWSAD